jgi:hypothetical protein
MAALQTLGPGCRDDFRRGTLLLHPVLNGIDFVEYERRPLAVNPCVLVVNFLKPLPDPPHSDPDGAYGLTQAVNLGLITLQGGTRIVNIRPLAAQLVGGRLEIAVSEEGDFSTYLLGLGWRLQPNGTWLQQIPALDVQFSIAPVNFKAGCPTDFDCRDVHHCPPQADAEPVVDYLAKDYASFRRQLLDLAARLNPGWVERSPADVGVALLELLAYEGDHLSYYQDAVANEAYLDTARQRSSAKKHARLVDYIMHEGRNAWAFVQFEVGSTGTVPMHTKVLSRVIEPLRSRSAPPAAVIPEADVPPAAFESDPALAPVRVFETAFDLAVHDTHNTLFIHTWGDARCCLPVGICSVYLYTLGAAIGTGERPAILPVLAPGDFLLLEEVMGPQSGAKADADPTHRQVVRIESVRSLTVGDPAFRDLIAADGALQIFRVGDTPMPLMEVTWRRADALTFPLCLSATALDERPLRNVAVARGNVVLADHGRTTLEFIDDLVVPADRIFRQRLEGSPLTMQAQPDDVENDVNTALLTTPRTNLDVDARAARPAIALLLDFIGGARELWEPVPDLLGSPGSAQHFAVEFGNDGRPTVRFGDDEYGKRPTGAASMTAIYRLGNGRAGNVGAEALAHVVQPTVAPAWPIVSAVRNPIAARAGTDPETIEEVRQYAPAAFRAEQFRAVVESDYTAAALKLPEVAGAVAQFRWTGSWYTVFIGIDPADPEDLITEGGGRTHLAPVLRDRVRHWLTRYKLAGYDLEIRSAEYVPLELAIELCVEPDYFRTEVVQAVRFALSNRNNPDGTRGFFHPDNSTFAQPVYLSRIYAAIEAVPGVLSAFVTVFHRFGKTANGELDSGVLPIGMWEIARLDNDAAFQENGVLRITSGGGK